jgi:hypothetical protein
MARADETAPDPAALLRLARQALSSAEFRKKFATADFWGPNEFYDPQLRFFANGANYHQRLIRGGNQVGKSFAAAFEASLHMTGVYPSWWQGRRFTKATRGWVIGPTAQLVRDGPQRQLCSKQGEFGTGTIPLASFTGKPVMVPGGTGSIDTLSVAHQAPMLGKHATNHGTDHFFLEPAVEEMCSYMHRGSFVIANHMSELGEEILSYHRDEDHRVVQMRDDVISAVRMAFMMRRSGKGLDVCDAYGVAPGMPNPEMFDPRPPRRDKTTRGGLAKGIDFDLFG